jgi:hypothetical protein
MPLCHAPRLGEGSGPMSPKLSPMPCRHANPARHSRHPSGCCTDVFSGVRNHFSGIDYSFIEVNNPFWEATLSHVGCENKIPVGYWLMLAARTKYLSGISFSQAARTKYPLGIGSCWLREQNTRWVSAHVGCEKETRPVRNGMWVFGGTFRPSGTPKTRNIASLHRTLHVPSGTTCW